MPYEGYTAVGVEVKDGVATLTLDHPPMNLFDFTLFPDVGRAAAELASDDDVRVVVLRSAVPDYFVAHFDVSIIQQLPTDASELEQKDAWVGMCETFRTMPKATIAVIEGRAGGGGSELALACDMRFADRERAVFNQVEVSLGLLPGGGGMARLARLMGRSRALEAVLGCDDIPADVAELYGWVNRALPQNELWPFVERLAQRIAGFPAHAVATAKEAVLRAEKDVVADLMLDVDAFTAILAVPETRAAMDRFLKGGGQTVEGESRLGDLVASLGGKP